MEILKAISIKKTIAIILTLVFSYLAIVGVIDGQQFFTVFTMIISFYFGQSVANQVMHDVTQNYDTK